MKVWVNGKGAVLIRLLDNHKAVVDMDGRNFIVDWDDIEESYCMVCGRESDRGVCRSCIIKEADMQERRKWREIA